MHAFCYVRPVVSASPTIELVLQQAIERLSTCSTSARLDAQILLAAALERPRSHLSTHPEAPVPAHGLHRFETWLRQRASGIPVAYLTGQKGFWSLELQVTPQVLIPRPETELLVELALQWLAPDAAARVLDLGTGSGAIALAIARERPRAGVIATDLCAAALQVARGNAGQLGLDNVEFLQGDWFEALRATPGRLPFDLIVSNPPYIAGDDAALDTPGLRAEPRQALTPGPLGLEAIERIVRTAGAHLRDGGRLAMEHGADQATAVRALLASHGFMDIHTAQDLAGRDRVSFATGCRAGAVGGAGASGGV